MLVIANRVYVFQLMQRSIGIVSNLYLEDCVLPALM